MSIIAQSYQTGTYYPTDSSTWISGSVTTNISYPYKPKPEKWTCKYCKSKNKPDDDNCPHCGAPAGDEA